jgi:hypothetical protein
VQKFAKGGFCHNKSFLAKSGKSTAGGDFNSHDAMIKLSTIKEYFCAFFLVNSFHE